MASYPFCRPVRDLNGLPMAYNEDSKARYCCTAANGDRWVITRPSKPYNIMGVKTGCDQLWCSYTGAVTLPAAPPTPPIPLDSSTGDKFYIPDREHIQWFYLPFDVENIFFACNRAGAFEAVFLQTTHQMQDADL